MMLSPLMLLGLLGLSIPVAIHLIQKQRLKPQPLATMHFLDAEDVANSFAPLPRDILQLILRLILLFIMVLLLTRLTVPSHDRGPRTMVLILDQSMSMKQLTDNEKTLYENMKSQAVDIVKRMHKSDEISLQFVGDRVTATDFISDREKLLKILSETDVSDSGALALMPTIRQSVNLLRSRHSVNPCVVVFSDHQKLNYQSYLEDSEKEQSVNFKKHLQESRVKLLFIDPQNSVKENVGIVQSVFSSNDSYLGSSAAMTVTAKNYGTEAKTVNLKFTEGNTDGASRQLQLEPGESAQMDLVHRFETPVDTACKVSIENDSLMGDNEFYLPMKMKDRTQILMVTKGSDNEEGKNRSVYKGADLFAFALNPGEALGTGNGTYINVKRVTSNVLMNQALPIFSMVVLYGVSDLAEQSQEDLQNYVKNGGSLMITLEAGTSPASIRMGLGSFLKNLNVGQLKEGEDVQGLNRNESLLDSNIFYPLIHGDWGDLDNITVSKFFNIENTSQSKVLLRTTAGDPLIITHSYGKGQVVINSFDCDLTSSSLPRTSAFIPVCQELLKLMTARENETAVQTMRAGDSIRLSAKEFKNLKGDLKISGPDTFAVPLFAEEDSILFNQAVKAGAYELSHPLKKSGRKHWVTVNPVENEADTTPLSNESMTKLFSSSMKFIRYNDIDGQFSNREEIIPFMILVLFFVFAIEAAVGAWNSQTKIQTEARQ